MAMHRITLSKWLKRCEDLEGQSDTNGPSPGGCASDLGISRQAVHKAINRGELDAWRVVQDKGGALVAIIIWPSTMETYQAARNLRRA